MKPVSESRHTSARSEKLAARTSNGLHDEVLSYLTQVLKPQSKVLDLGAGTGAWAERLLASGYEVTCVERDIAGFGLDSVPCVGADLNENFSTAIRGRYAAITSIEVLEHLENPRHLLRECRNLLDEDGILLITTPNVECVAGRLRFLRSGHFRMFDKDEALNDPTHITPIQTFMFERALKDTGYKLLLHETNNPEPRVMNRLARFICKLAAPFVSGFKGGDHHIFILAKA
jgi:2-polyprenyl-3-methyl-5-hydroxy-6-metoxy-1,4-benzoquinol methylase